jgi:hypothetical protein
MLPEWVHRRMNHVCSYKYKVLVLRKSNIKLAVQCKHVKSSIILFPRVVIIADNVLMDQYPQL